MGRGKTSSIFPPKAGSEAVVPGETWGTVIGRKARRQQAKAQVTRAAPSKSPHLLSKKGSLLRPKKQRTPKTAAVIVTCPEVGYKHFFVAAREQVKLKELGSPLLSQKGPYGGLTAGNPRRGGRQEGRSPCRRPEGEAQPKGGGARCASPENGRAASPRAEGFSPDTEVVATIAAAAGCTPDEVQTGTIRVWASCGPDARSPRRRRRP